MALNIILIAMLVAAAEYARRSERLKGYAFALWVFAFVGAALVWPGAFRSWGAFETKRLITPLIQVIMFGMGTGLSGADFLRVARMPGPVAAGLGLQYTIMPLTAYALARLFAFDAEVAAGIILIGCCSAGVASNVMSWLARGDVALSVTMTTFSTLLAPLITPAAMTLLAGRYMPVDAAAMMREIVQIVLAPVLAGVLVHQLLRGRAAWLQALMPSVSMWGICLIVAIIVSLSRDKLLEVGLRLMVAASALNVIGCLLGYAGARMMGFNETIARTIAFQTGLRNGGMASGLAINVLHSGEAALGPAIFGPWMNIFGSSLASFWRGRPEKQADKGQSSLALGGGR